MKELRHTRLAKYLHDRIFNSVGNVLVTEEVLTSYVLDFEVEEAVRADHIGKQVAMIPVDKSHDMMRLFWHLEENWSDVTFGPASHRGPEGPLKHLLREVLTEMFDVPHEEVDVLLAHLHTTKGIHDLVEYVDLQHLVFDAARREGYSYDEFVLNLFQKFRKNQERTWPDWRVMSNTEPIEHDRSGEEVPHGERDESNPSEARLRPVGRVPTGTETLGLSRPRKGKGGVGHRRRRQDRKA